MLRYGNVYGPRQNPHGEAGVIAIFCNRLLNNLAPIINGNGEQTRDYVFVGDVVRANIMALETSSSGIFNVGTGQETSVRDDDRLSGQIRARYSREARLGGSVNAADVPVLHPASGWRVVRHQV